MIFLHLLLGLILGKLFGHTLLFVIASMLPDIDHLYIIIKHKLFPLKRTIQVLKKEEEHNIRFKTPLMHSLLGLLLCSGLFFISIQNVQLTLFFSLAYCSHLLLDWPDIDKKQYLYPLKREFSGFLPIWSKTEQILTILASLIIIFLYL